MNIFIAQYTTQKRLVSTIFHFLLDFLSITLSEKFWIQKGRILS